MKCSVCGKQLSAGNQSGLCQECYRKKVNEDKIAKWKETGCKVSTTLRNCIRDYIADKQEHKCAICGIDSVWQGKPLNFILDHINGDASNNWEYNLRLICPNCDSQLDTYKSKNSARRNIKEVCRSQVERNGLEIRRPFGVRGFESLCFLN